LILPDPLGASAQMMLVVTDYSLMTATSVRFVISRSAIGVRILPESSRHVTEQAEAVLREQYVTLRQQIPLMYLLMFINVAFLGIVASRDSSLEMSLGVPVGLSIIIVLRAGAWILRRKEDLTTLQIRQYLRQTVAVAAILSILFGGWGLVLFSGDNPVRSTSVALYVFVGSISCCYCLQALPVAARMVLLFGAMPVTIRLLLSQDWYLVGIGLTFVLVAVVILRTIATNRSAVSEVLRSRSEMSSLLTALQKSEEHYRYSVELNPQIPWISDPEGRLLELSPRWTALTGINVEDALGWGWSASVHPDDLPGVLEQWQIALSSGDGAKADARYRLRHADGQFRWCRARANPRRDADGQIVSWYGNLEDIHDKVTAELALRESEERYRLASRATNDLIWDWSHATNRIEWAGDVETILGYTEAAQGTTIAWWTEHIHPDDLPAVLDTYARVADNAQDNWSHEYRFQAADGSYVHIFSRGYVVRDAEGKALRSIGALLDITAAKRVEDDLRWAAYHDPLTRLPNRKFFAEKLEAALADAAANASCVAVTVIDVDGFKLINDSLGHAAGDTVLKMVATRLQSNLPGDATVARLGGDEFAVILPGLAPADACALTMTRILDGVGDVLTIDESVMSISVSAGAAMWPMDGETAEDILKSADLALYAAKAEGSGAARGFKPAMREAIESRKTMLRDAREALNDDRVIPFYQAKIAFGTGEIVGFEALLRWHHHRRGLQPPHTIQAAFDDSLLSTQLTDRMIDRVLADMAIFLEQGRTFGRIAINGSPGDFRRDDFADRILTKFRRAGLPPSLLELEITETVFLEQIASNVERALRTLAAEGVTIALDDFGTGYASLTHLQKFPVHVLKIDRSFISRLDSADSADFAIVHGVIDIARKMNIATVAEGVETEKQADHLRELGCDIGQGYLFSRAISAARVPLWIDKWTEARSDGVQWTAARGTG
jgi:diguanylate cyclase (GGDEF)-like protein/PAS domain S-box-containing protein